MSYILNFLNHRNVAIASLGAFATVTAYCVYNRRSWLYARVYNFRQLNHQRQASSGDSTTATASTVFASSPIACRKNAVSTSTTASSDDSGVQCHSDVAGSFVGLREPIRGSVSSLASVVSMETISKDAGLELARCAEVICGGGKSAQSVAKDEDAESSATVDAKEWETSSESVAVITASVLNLTQSTQSEKQEEVKSTDMDSNDLVKTVAKDAVSTSSVTSAPALTPQFVEARLRVLGNAPDGAPLILVEGDAEVLATRLRSLRDSDNSPVSEQVTCLQLIGRHLLLPQRADILCRNGRLVEVLVELYTTSADVEIRVRCLLALGSARSAGFVAVETVERIVGRLAADIAVSRLRPHALRLLCQLGAACRPEVALHAATLLTYLRPLAVEAATSDGSFGLLTALLSGLLTDAASRPVILGTLLLGGVGQLCGPEARAMRSDLGLRVAWLELLAAICACAAELGDTWWAAATATAPTAVKTQTLQLQLFRKRTTSAKSVAPVTLAGAIRAQLPELYKQVKKLCAKLKSAEKRTPHGVRLLAVKQQVKSLKELAKKKPKSWKK